MAGSNELSQEFKKEVRKQATEQAAKWTVAAVAALAIFALTGWWFYLEDKIKSLAGGVPPGAVVAFDRTPSNPCPLGWTVWREATSRVIVGAGDNTDAYEDRFKRDEYGKPLTPRAYREHGGAEFYQLKAGEIPSHSHKGETNSDGKHVHSGRNEVLMGVKEGTGVGGNGGSWVTGFDPLRDTNSEHTHSFTTEQDGGANEAHQNMPPYVALYYCKKSSS